jgi:hypothetical protein
MMTCSGQGQLQAGLALNGGRCLRLLFGQKALKWQKLPYTVKKPPQIKIRSSFKYTLQLSGGNHAQDLQMEIFEM